MNIVYESPEIQEMEIDTEGVLCKSGQFEDWEEELIPW